MPKRRRSYDAWLLKKLASPEAAERYLKMASADSPARFFEALGKVAEAKRMAKIAEEVGVNRESLYRSLSQEGNPAYSTVSAVLDALGMELDVRLKDRVQTPVAPRPQEPQKIAAEADTISNLESVDVPPIESNQMSGGAILMFPSPGQAKGPSWGPLAGTSRRTQQQAACGD